MPDYSSLLSDPEVQKRLREFQYGGSLAPKRIRDFFQSNSFDEYTKKGLSSDDVRMLDDILAKYSKTGD